MSTALSINNLHKVYANGFEALKDVSFDVQDGDFFALLGPNGAGKSTIIGIVTSLINKSSGKVHVYGTSIDTDFSKAKEYLGLVPQEFNFNMFEPLNETLLTQAGYYGIPRPVARKRSEKLLEVFGLADKSKEIVRNLSGGLKRRLMIARALVHHPKLLILDEPTAGVDIEVRHLIWKSLKEINAQGTTIILTTHYLDEAESLCKNIGIIDRGEIIENTTMRDLLDSLESTDFVLYLKDKIDTIPDLNGYKIKKIDSKTIEVSVSKELGLNELFTELSQHGIRVNSMKNKMNRLETLFLEMVSKSKEAKK
jgi:ABC-2 type transport system ATP-binding protein